MIIKLFIPYKMYAHNRELLGLCLQGHSAQSRFDIAMIPDSQMAYRNLLMILAQH